MTVDEQQMGERVKLPTPLSLAVGANFIHIVNRHGVEIAEMLLPLGGGSKTTFAKRKAEAESIVEACNSHAALRADLKQYGQHVCGCSVEYSDCDCGWYEKRKALALGNTK